MFGCLHGCGGLIHAFNDDVASHELCNTNECPLINREYPVRMGALPGPFYGAALLWSSVGRVEAIVAQTNGRLAHIWLDETSDETKDHESASEPRWQGPVWLPGYAAAAPAFIQGRYGAAGNYEVIVPTPGGGLSHFYRDYAIRPDHAPRSDTDFGTEDIAWDTAWRTAPPPINYGNWSGVGLVHSHCGKIEIVGVMDHDLVYMCQAHLGGEWSLPQKIASGFRGRPALIQSTNGTKGNLEVVAARQDSGLSHFWLDNDHPLRSWSCPYALAGPASLCKQAFDDVTMLQDGAGRLRILARQHYQLTFASFVTTPEGWGEIPSGIESRCC